MQSKQARDKVAVITLFGRLLEDELAWCKADGTDLVTYSRAACRGSIIRSRCIKVKLGSCHPVRG